VRLPHPGLLAVAGALTIAFSGIMVRLADVEPSTAAFFRCAYALPALLPLVVWERRKYGPRVRKQVALAWGAGFLFTADLILWHHSIAAVGAGLGTVLGNVQVLLVGLAAWLFLGERLGRRMLAAVPVAFVGVVLISGVVGEGAYGDDPRLGAVFGIGTAIAYTGFILVLRAGNADMRRPAGPLFDATLACALGCLVVGAALGELDLRPSWPAHGWLVLLALTAQVLGWLLITLALPRLPAALTSVLLTSQPVAAVLLAMVLVDEQPSLVQLLGIVVVIGAILLATAGRKPEPAAPAPP
jgi:drug/metabolite transporter (DMT)-like permease